MESASSPIEPTPRWFGPPERPLFGWLHLPADRTVRGGVVLCQPLGIDAICVYFTYRLLADRLAEQGLAVLRFDYDGTGDSTGQENDPDRVDAWMASLAAATDELLATGVTTIGLVGIRMGGLFAAHEAVRRGGVDALALWDPCISGQAYLREQRFLRHLAEGGDEEEDGAVEAPGLRFEPESVAALADVAIAGMDGVLAKRTLVLLPPGASKPRALQRRLDGLDVDWQEATGQEALLDSARQEPPLITIDRIVDWFARELQGETVTVAEQPAQSSHAMVGVTSDGLPVVEYTVTLGDLGLFGIVTESPGGRQSPTIILVNEGNTHHIGQARLWVDLARVLGAAGFRTLRFDLSGIGDSGTRPGQASHVSRAPEAIEDVYIAMQGISPDDPTDVFLIGFCSGAYEVIEQALVHPPRGIALINPTFSFVLPEPEGTSVRLARQRSKRWLVRMAGPLISWAGRNHAPAEVDRWLTALETGTWPMAIAKRRPDIPDPIWRFVSRHLIDNRATDTLERIAASRTQTFLISGTDDFVHISIGSDDRVQVLREAPNFNVIMLEELSHASWVMWQRRRLVEVLTTQIQEAYATD